MIRLGDIQDLGRGVANGGGDIVDDERIADAQVVDVILRRGGGLSDGSVAIGLGRIGDQRDGGCERDTDQVWIHYCAVPSY